MALRSRSDHLSTVKAEAAMRNNSMCKFLSSIFAACE